MKVNFNPNIYTNPAFGKKADRRKTTDKYDTVELKNKKEKEPVLTCFKKA